jgi:DNA-binding NarL/FixJ family response regulator
MISKQQFEAQLQQIFRLLLENKTQEEIAHELNISTRTVARYFQRIDQRYGEAQKQKTDSTLFLEMNLLKNRLLKLYKSLEDKVIDPETSGNDCARCADVAVNIAISVIKLESDGIKMIKQLGLASSASNASSVGVTAHKNNNNAVASAAEYNQQIEDNDRKF